MTIGNDGAGPVGVPPVGPNPNAGQIIGTGGAMYPPLYLASFESLMAAVSRGEVSLNQVMAAGNQFGGVAGQAGSQLGNPTLMQGISQGLPQNGTNGINGVAAGGGTVNSSMASLAAPQNPGGVNAKSMGGTQPLDAKQMVNDTSVALLSPIQYGGN